MSTRAFGLAGIGGIAILISTSVAIAIGTLIRKMPRHETVVTSQPPTSGPTRKAIPVQAVHVPIAAPRSSPSKSTEIVASDAGVSRAPATPCAERAVIREASFHATAHSTEVIAKAITPITKIRRCPKQVPSEPPIRISALSVSR